MDITFNSMPSRCIILQLWYLHGLVNIMYCSTSLLLLLLLCDLDIFQGHYKEPLKQFHMTVKCGFLIYHLVVLNLFL